MEPVVPEKGISPATFLRLLEDYQLSGKSPHREVVIDVTGVVTQL
ncbi:hypothetical protein RNZ50_25485 [Paracoccaceae bacterium Fryx2]|jgi:hypothetical protein|nr:hypothetical protein [Paracoccaceae bacterium Fryx2]